MTLGKQIAELVQEYKALADAEAAAAMPDRKRSKRTGDDRGEKRQDADTSLHMGVEDRVDVGSHDADDVNDEKDAVETLHADDEKAMASPRRTKAEQRALKREEEAEKSKAKATRNQQRHGVRFTQQDIDTVARAIHGEDYGAASTKSSPLATDENIDDLIKRNLSFVSALESHRSLLVQTVAKQRKILSEPAKRSRRSCAGGVGKRDSSDLPGGDNNNTDAFVFAIAVKLGVSLAGAGGATTQQTSFKNTSKLLGGASKVKKPVMQRLCQAIAEDVKKHENELRETAVRTEGFWRYATTEVFFRMKENAEKVDRKTGAILRERAGGAGQDRADDGLEEERVDEEDVTAGGNEDEDEDDDEDGPPPLESDDDDGLLLDDSTTIGQPDKSDRSAENPTRGEKLDAEGVTGDQDSPAPSELKSKSVAAEVDLSPVREVVAPRDTSRDADLRDRNSNSGGMVLTVSSPERDQRRDQRDDDDDDDDEGFTVVTHRRRRRPQYRSADSPAPPAALRGRRW